MSFSVALLATHQEEQEELYKHVRSVVPDGRLPVRGGSSRDLCSLGLLDLPRCSATHSGSRRHLRDTTPFPSSKFHFIHHSVICPKYYGLHNAHLGNLRQERNSRRLCDPDGFGGKASGPERDIVSTNDLCNAP